MARIARVVVPGFVHHVTQQGNHCRGVVFAADGDQEVYLQLLKQFSDKYGLLIWAYCLLPNQVHLVAAPRDEQALSNALRNAHAAYAAHFSARTGDAGSLWRGRFNSCPVDDPYVWPLVRYVETLPVQLGEAKSAEAYRWSSAAAHCGLCENPVLSKAFPPPGIIEDWAAWLRGCPARDRAVDRILGCTRTGRPCGDAAFYDHVETLLDRHVRPKKRGRKPRSSLDAPSFP